MEFVTKDTFLNATGSKLVLPEIKGVPKGEVLSLVDQSVCSKANIVLLNDFSTYSGK